MQNKIDGLQIHPNTKFLIKKALDNKDGNLLWELCADKNNKVTRQFLRDNFAACPTITANQRDWRDFCATFSREAQLTLTKG